MNKDMIKQVSELAAQAAIEKFEKLKLQEQERLEDRRLYNTKLLLRNYRRLKLYCEGIAEVAPELLFAENADFMKNMHVHSIKDSKARTFAMMGFIDNMISVYEMNVKQSRSIEMERQLDTIRMYYLSDTVQLAIPEIAERHHVSERTVQRDLQEGIYTLSILFFGADGIRVRL